MAVLHPLMLVGTYAAAPHLHGMQIMLTLSCGMRVASGRGSGSLGLICGCWTLHDHKHSSTGISARSVQIPLWVLLAQAVGRGTHATAQYPDVLFMFDHLSVLLLGDHQDPCVRVCGCWSGSSFGIFVPKP